MARGVGEVRSGVAGLGHLAEDDGVAAPDTGQLLQRFADAGIYTTHREIGGMLQIVCASHFSSRGLHGSSLWLSWVDRAEGVAWYVGTWGNRFYRVPGDGDVVAVCQAILRSSKRAIHEVSSSLVDALGLQEEENPFPGWEWE